MIGTLTSQVPQDDRKNLVNTIKWICEEFENEKDVAIILKTNFGKGSNSDKEMCRNYLTNLLSEVRGDKKYPAVYLIHGNLKKQEINRRARSFKR